MRISLIMLALLAFSSNAMAQSAANTPASTQPTADQQAAQRMNQNMVNAAAQVVKLIDTGKMGEVWDGASSIAKQSVTRAAFIKQINNDRTTLGPISKRTLQGVGYSQGDGNTLPAGVYANVSFATKFAKQTEPVRELISFHMDSDKIWRVTGYTVR